MQNVYHSYLTWFVQVVLILFTFALLASPAQASNPGFTVTEPAPFTGTDNQTAATVVTVPNVAETLASITIGVTGVPADSATSTIGDCLITFSDVLGTTTDQLDCAGDTATIDLTTGAGDDPRSAADLAALLAQLTNITDGTRTLTATTSTATTTVFTTVSPETATSTIAFDAGTATELSEEDSTAGVIAQAQVNTLTIGGTIEVGDTFRATLPTVGNVDYVVASGVTTAAQVATALRAAILASTGYAGQAFTAAASENTIVFTAKVAGTGFTQTSAALNTAQRFRVNFLVTDVKPNYNFRITVNGIQFTFLSTNTSAASVAIGLYTQMFGNIPGVTCQGDDGDPGYVFCVVQTPGNTFTYSTNVSARSSGGSGRVVAPVTVPPTTPFTPTGPTTPTTPAVTLAALQAQVRAIIDLARAAGLPIPQQLTDFVGASPLARIPVRDLTMGATGDDVKDLQTLLINRAAGPRALALKNVGATGLFGPLTRDALAELQAANGITPAQGYFGPRTRAFLGQ